jgi:ribosomal protein RSM22 (predicted rRNA methylase)
MCIPDVSGFRLDKAQEILGRSGVENIIVQVTEPPKSIERSCNNASRVVRQEVAGDGTVRLLVCNPDLHTEENS